MERKSHSRLLAPRIRQNGSIPYRPLPDHRDPDFKRLTYGEPWGRINPLKEGDVAFFIESGTNDEWKSWGYYVVAYFVTERVYVYNAGNWTPKLEIEEHIERINENAHAKRGDLHYAVLLGDVVRSKFLFTEPLKLTVGQGPILPVKFAMKLPISKRYTGYWWKTWFGAAQTKALLTLINCRPQRPL